MSSNNIQGYDTTWFNSTIQELAGYFIEKYGELPRPVIQHSNNFAFFDAFNDEKQTPGPTNSILHREKSLLSREVSFIRQRIDSASKINIFDLYETNGESALPFIYELLEHEALGKYIPVTINPNMNNHAIKKLKLFTENSALKGFNHDSIWHNIFNDNFRQYIRTVLTDENGVVEQNQVNLFLLMGSSLGNFINIKPFLKNVYDTMNTGDYLAIIQAIYRSGTEDGLVEDFIHISRKMQDTQHMASVLTGDQVVKVKWDPEIAAVRMSVTVQESQILGGYEISQGQEINLFRSSRFEDDQLRRCFKEIGFKLVDTAYDNTMDNALYFLEK